ncbi:MAG TPA: hypothetical protein VHZ53_05680 [Steroidobacteraceae bacterium]|nr:hypothetical protein [Steroidobacteraceae bacterium]
MRARLLIILMGATTFCSAGRAMAGPLSAEPLIGVAAEYTDNPALAVVGGRSESHEALLVNLPINYDLDQVHFALTPSVRYSDAPGYSSVTSDYYHLDARTELDDDFDVFSASAAFHRDSSLLYAGEVADGVGVRRDTSSADAYWQRRLNERLDFKLDVSTMRTLYDETTAVPTLLAYRYSSGLPMIEYAVDERTKFRIVGAIGRYYSLDHLTSSESKSLQLGYDRALNELWTVDVTAGYSRAVNAYDFYLFGFFYLGTIKSNENGTVFSATLSRQSERLVVNTTISRQLVPTGIDFLTRQDTVAASANFNLTERWTFDANASWNDNLTPDIGGGNTERRYYNVVLSALWHWTEQWQVSMSALRISQRFAAGLDERVVNPVSNGLSLQMAYHFHRTNQ